MVFLFSFFFRFLFLFFFSHPSLPPFPPLRGPPGASPVPKMKKERKKETKKQRKKERKKERTRRQKQVLLHSRMHKNFLSFACVETPHSDIRPCGISIIVLKDLGCLKTDSIRSQLKLFQPPFCFHKNIGILRRCPRTSETCSILRTAEMDTRAVTRCNKRTRLHH